MELSKIYLGICKDDDEIRSHSSHIGVSGHEYFLEIAKRWAIPMPSFLDFHPYDLSIRGLFCPPIESGGLLRSSEVDYSIRLKGSLRYLCHGPMLRHNPFNQQ